MKYNIENFHPSPGKIPNHVGLIPDGTRRWSLNKGVSLLEGYTNAMHNIVSHISFLYSLGVKYVSIYLSSYQNFKRSTQEIMSFCEAETLLCNELLPDLSEKFDTKVKVAGNMDVVPAAFRQALKQISFQTVNKLDTRLYLCVAYNPLEEVILALSKSDQVDEFITNLWVPEPIDIVIRTSGVNLLSNFLPIQSGYARIYVINKLYNDVNLVDIQNIITIFSQLHRKFGE